MSLSIALSAGGTGGHLLPALAVADAIRAERPDASITFIGSTRRMDATLLEARGMRVATTGVVSYSSARDLPRTLARLASATRSAGRIMRRDRIDAVCGFGGYASLPALLAAAPRRVPRLVHEANALPRLGLANRIAMRAGAEVWGGFPETGTAIRAKVHACGVPLRAEIATLDRARRRRDARERFGRSPEATIVLVVGGSLGARRLNAAVGNLIETGVPDGWELIWSIGDAEPPAMRHRAARHRGVSVHAFIEDMASAYAAADIVVGRAGAATVAELEHLGMRAILVPLGIARQAEQHRNAAHLVARGGATILHESELSAETLAVAVRRGLDEPEPAPDPRHASAAATLARRLVERAEAPR